VGWDGLGGLVDWVIKGKRHAVAWDNKTRLQVGLLTDPSDSYAKDRCEKRNE
jgi:hypothetical protein